MAEEEKKLLGSELKERLLSKISDVGQSISQRAQEDDPDSWSDEAARLAVGTAQTAGAIAGAPVIKETLSVLDFPFYMLRQSAGAVMEHGFGVDPWYGQTAVGLGEVALGGKGLVTGAKKLRHAQQVSGAVKAYKKGAKYIPESAILPTEQISGLQYRLRRRINIQAPNQLNLFFPWEMPRSPAAGWAIAKRKPGVKRKLQLDSAVTNKFKDHIWNSLEFDDIRTRDISLRGLGGRTKLEGYGGKGIGELYFDYLEGYYNRWGDFKQADIIELPNGKIIGPEIFDTRGLKLSQINPAQKGAFYRGAADLKVDIRKGLRLGMDAKIDSHHLDMIAASFPLYRGLNTAQKTKVRNMIESAGIFTGDNPLNRWDLPKPVHNEVHKFLTTALERQGISDLQSLIKPGSMRTAASRKTFIDKYIQAIRETEDEMKFIINNYIGDTKIPNRSISQLKDAELDDLVDILERSDYIYEIQRTIIPPPKVPKAKVKPKAKETKPGWRLSTKTEDLDPPGRGKTIPKSG